MSLQTALDRDNHLPALCYSFSWDGNLTEGFLLNSDDPRTAPVPALFVGKTYIRRHSSDGCLFASDSMLVRRAGITERQNGQHTMYFLASPKDEGAYLVYFDLTIPDRWKLKGEQFYDGVHTTARKLVDDTDHYLYLIRKGEEATVFLPDGL